MPDLPDPAHDQISMDALLAPLAPQAPCGPALRYDPVFTEIRLLREEDDPSLPMGQWERPLKHADWPQIERLCCAMLAQRSKDLQIAVWLAESWMRQHGFAGLMQGLGLVDALLHSYWPFLHPVIDADDGSADARLAPLEWLNESLSTSVRLHAAILTVDTCKPTEVTLAEWERLTAQEMAMPEHPAGDAAQLTRAAIAEAAQQMDAALAATGAAVRQSLAHLHAITGLLQRLLEAESPSLARLEGTLEAVLRVLAQLDSQPEAGDIMPMPAQAAASLDSLAQPDSAAPGAATAAADTALWRNRREAYATLEALADYLSEVEPHSPTPFLIRRAVRWGRMSLPEVIVEIMQEDGNLGGLLNVLGIRNA